MPSWPILVFDIETIPDVAGLRALRQMDAGIDDAGVYAAEIAERKERGKSDFMPLYLQRILVISCVFRNAEGLRIHSIVDRESDEVLQGEVPPYSVVVSGTMPGKPMKNGEPGPGLYCAVIVKRVDEKTRSKTSINELLRD